MRKTNILWALAFVSLAGFALGGCGDDDMTGVDGGPGVDSGPMPDAPGTDAPVPQLCNDYCTMVTGTCTGANLQYADMADCLAFCAQAGWPDGEEGATDGNSLQCRLYHVGVAATMMPEMHCPHAGPSGGGVCGTVDFRTDAADAFTRVDRMGMPAVSTALITNKDAYNDGDPSDDAALTFAADLLGNLADLHTALDDDIMNAPPGGLGFTPCSADASAGLPECATQEVVAGGPTVASLVIPDTLQIDPGTPAGFPNGRQLTDPVIDVTLAIILLQMGGGCPNAASPCTPTTFADVPVNPAANDVAFDTAFPYLAAPH